MSEHRQPEALIRQLQQRIVELEEEDQQWRARNFCEPAPALDRDKVELRQTCAPEVQPNNRLYLYLSFSLPNPHLLASTHKSSSGNHKSFSSSAHKSSTSLRHSNTASSSTSQKFGNCDYPEQLDSAGRRCGSRAASVRAEGRLGGYQ